MIVKPIKTSRVAAGSITLTELLEEYLPELVEGSVLAITSKIVSLCENRVVPIDNADKEELVKLESTYYLPGGISDYGYHFTVTNNTLISSAGIDESNGNDNYILWPSNSQKTTNEIRSYLKQRFGLSKVGVIITDSTCTPFRLGTTGISLAYCGFRPLKNYVGTPDLFGRDFNVSRANIAGGLAATAVLAMGEGAEQTPFVIMSDLPFVEFIDHDPTAKELSETIVQKEDDLFAPFFNAVDWLHGDNKD